jgi:hypothetical protein
LPEEDLSTLVFYQHQPKIIGRIAKRRGFALLARFRVYYRIFGIVFVCSHSLAFDSPEWDSRVACRPIVNSAGDSIPGEPEERLAWMNNRRSQYALSANARSPRSRNEIPMKEVYRSILNATGDGSRKATLVSRLWFVDGLCPKPASMSSARTVARITSSKTLNSLTATALTLRMWRVRQNGKDCFALADRENRSSSS